MDPLPGMAWNASGLGRGAGLGGDDEERRERVEVVEAAATAAGSVESRTRTASRHRGRRTVRHVRGEAAPAHPGHDGGREARVARRRAERLQRGDLVAKSTGPRASRGGWRSRLDRLVGDQSVTSRPWPDRPTPPRPRGEGGSDGRGEGRVVDPGVERARANEGCVVSAMQVLLRGGATRGGSRRARGRPRPDDRRRAGARPLPVLRLDGEDLASRRTWRGAPLKRAARKALAQETAVSTPMTRAPEGEHVHVVVLDALAGGVGVVADRARMPRHLGGGDRGAHAAAADEDAPIRLDLPGSRELERRAKSG